MRGQPAGKRNKYVTIEKPTEGTPDSLGATAKTWTVFARRWAAVLPQTSREYYASNQIHAEMTHMLEMVYVPDIHPAMRIDLDGRKLNIISAIDKEEQHAVHQLICTEVLSYG